ncbi:membrane glycosyltransferase [Bradyrhizobium shewense]|uniref:Glucans biosynthesis glucosyltransferase H n=1 Tax=Bradyrhizobium shewense TaxID=1761772 RepID=A0A1C3XSV7_9BRAD|nr:membrane glycosyltransferase [Bradyrhizobium shewense]
MGTLNTAPRPAAGDIATQRLLPRESPLPMAPGDLGKNRVPDRVPAAVAPAMAWRRGLILLSTAALTGGGGYEMYRVLEVGGVTVLEAMVLTLFLVLLAWVAFSFASAVAGFFVLLGHRFDGDAFAAGVELPAIASRTAMLLPTYNEDPHRLTARLRAIIESLEATNHGELFDWFVLSDSTDPDIWVAEEKALLALRQAVGTPKLYYRHRADNTERKAGNISEWIKRFGAVYDFMIVLDADSLMSGQTIVRLVHAIETNPTAGLVQTLPIIVNARSLFSRVQQFAGRLYGPMIAAGVAWWHGSEGNYWGHNAIIRVKAFAEAAALPQLHGRKPFGGHILSHDFVEAALMRRAGWGIYMLPTLRGSYEEVPPSLLDFAARDRRWCQGNLQHLAVVPARGLHWLSRLHFMVGIGAYLTAPLWLLFLLLGMLISLQARFVRPEYFPKGFSLFPTWPAQDPVLAIWVFVATMGLLLLPKLLSLAPRLDAALGAARIWRGIANLSRSSRGDRRLRVDGAGDDDLSVDRGRRDSGRPRCWLADSKARRRHRGAPRALSEIRRSNPVRRCDGGKRLRRFAAASALDVAGHHWAVVRCPHRGPDRQAGARQAVCDP